jgi:repressor LexA
MVLTKNQEKVLRFVTDFALENGFPPSVREIGSALGGIKSSTVAYYVKVLTRKGFLTRGSSRARDLRLASSTMTYGIGGLGARGHPVLGTVPAGRPNLAQDQVEEVLWLDHHLTRSKDSYLLRVKGDSMTGAGLVEGDMLIIKPQPTADPGDIVVALTPDGEGTVKKLSRKNERYYLEPANPAYSPIPQPFRVVGKVVGLLRRM